MAARTRADRVKDPEKIRARNRQWRKDNPEQWRRIKRNSDLKRLYGISMHEYEHLIRQQGNACAICRGPLTPFPYVDHDHLTGEVRGVLCGPHNLAIGLLQDDPELAEQLVRYLRKELKG